jgi:hypothetical protein
LVRFQTQCTLFERFENQRRCRFRFYQSEIGARLGGIGESKIALTKIYNLIQRG